MEVHTTIYEVSCQKESKIKKAEPDQVFRSNYKCIESSGEKEYITQQHSNAIGQVQTGTFYKANNPISSATTKIIKIGREGGREERGKWKRNL